MNQQKTREAIMKAGRRERRRVRLLGRICRNVRRKCARSSASSPMHYASVRVSSGPTSTRVRLGSVPVAYAPPPRQDSSRCSNPCSRETPEAPGDASEKREKESRAVSFYLFCSCFASSVYVCCLSTVQEEGRVLASPALCICGRLPPRCNLEAFRPDGRRMAAPGTRPRVQPILVFS